MSVTRRHRQALGCPRPGAVREVRAAPAGVERCGGDNEQLQRFAAHGAAAAARRRARRELPSAGRNSSRTASRCMLGLRLLRGDGGVPTWWLPKGQAAPRDRAQQHELWRGCLWHARRVSAQPGRAHAGADGEAELGARYMAGRPCKPPPVPGRAFRAEDDAGQDPRSPGRRDYTYLMQVKSVVSAPVERQCGDSGAGCGAWR